MKKKIFFQTIPSILLVFLPISLITGPFLPDLSISVMAIIFLLRCLVYKDYSYFNNYFFKYFLIFYLVCLFSSLISDFKLISSLKSFLYIRFGLFFLSVWNLISTNKKILKYIFFSLLISFLVLVLDGFFQYIFDKNIIGIKKHPTRLSGFFGDELILGSYLSRFLPILIGLHFLNKYKIKNIYNKLFYLLAILSIVLIYLTGERAAFLLSIMSIIYLIVMINKFSKNFLNILIISLILIFIANIQNPNIKQRMVDYTRYQLEIESGKSNGPNIYKGHFLIAKDLFKENPILGVGPKNFSMHCNNNIKYQSLPYICTTHPHNIYIQLLAETGIVGTLLIFLLFLILTYYSIKHIFFRIFKKIEIFNFTQICILSSFLITLWPFITTGSFFNNYLNIIFFFPIGIFISIRES